MRKAVNTQITVLLRVHARLSISCSYGNDHVDTQREFSFDTCPRCYPSGSGVQKLSEVLWVTLNFKLCAKCRLSDRKKSFEERAAREARYDS